MKAPFLLSLSSLLILASGYREYEHKYNYEITPILGYHINESNLNIDNEVSLGFRFVLNNYGTFRPEFSLDRSLLDVQYSNGSKTSITRLGFNEFYDLEDLSLLSQWNPYILTGVGIESFSNEVGENVDDVYFNYGLGIKYDLKKDDYMVRGEFKHMIDVDGLDHRFGLYVGLVIPFDKTYKYRDSDRDGIYNLIDRCPNTLIGKAVDKKGCEIIVAKDSDNDGVLDEKDSCPNTQAGLIVDSQGCEVDSDSDGVSDSKDSCKNSKKGVVVDSLGCEIDSDGDGVIDSADKCVSSDTNVTVDSFGCELDDDSDGVRNSQDKCPTSPKGATVNQVGCELDDDNDGIQNSYDACKETPLGITIDAKGCGLDGDKDGVYDDFDQCPNTPEDFDVDAKGCVAQKKLYIAFKSGKAEFSSNKAAESLKDFSNFLADHPFYIVIEGHSSSDGSATLNYFLSEDRAKRIEQEILFNGITQDRIEIAAFGEAVPIATNKTKEGRATNRRMNIKLFKSKEESLAYIANTHSTLGDKLVQEYKEKKSK
jgi:outer membrane protein OmpA-like peptidoglycan-associated protein